MQLFNTQYPNTATKDVKLSLYPFRIIFKLFVDNMFFENEIENNLIRNKIIVNVKRDAKVINDAIRENGSKCYFDETHITFETDKMNNFVEGHHIIPMGQQKSFNQNLDIVDNVIPLCPNCHRLIHLAKNEIKMKYIDKIVNKHNKLLSFNDITKEDLYELYCTNQ